MPTLSSVNPLSYRLQERKAPPRDHSAHCSQSSGTQRGAPLSDETRISGQCLPYEDESEAKSRPGAGPRSTGYPNVDQPSVVTVPFASVTPRNPPIMLATCA